MSPSYQTIPPANAMKEEPSSTPVPMMKKIGIAAMVGTALLVVGYSYGSSTNPAMIKSVTNSFAEMEKEDCWTGPCNKNRNEIACLSGTFTKGCKWYPHSCVEGACQCSSCSGVDCGNHRAVDCERCTSRKRKGEKYCHGECKWGFNWAFLGHGCYPKWMTSHPLQ